MDEQHKAFARLGEASSWAGLAAALWGAVAIAPGWLDGALGLGEPGWRAVCLFAALGRDRLRHRQAGAGRREMTTRLTRPPDCRPAPPTGCARSQRRGRAPRPARGRAARAAPLADRAVFLRRSSRGCCWRWSSSAWPCCSPAAPRQAAATPPATRSAPAAPRPPTPTRWRSSGPAPAPCRPRPSPPSTPAMTGCWRPAGGCWWARPRPSPADAARVAVWTAKTEAETGAVP